MTIIITTFERSPDGGKGLARDTRVRWALEEVGQPYEVRLVSVGAMKEPAHLRLHPFGQIPTYEEGDLSLFETGVIVFHLANALMENRNGLVIGADVRHATGTGERDGALALVDKHLYTGATFGADKGYDVHDFVEQLEKRGIRVHIARNTNGRRSAIDGRAARGKGYAASIKVRKRIEQSFGWTKTIGTLRKLPRIGLAKVSAWVHWNFAAYNLIRIGGGGEWWDPAPT